MIYKYNPLCCKMLCTLFATPRGIGGDNATVINEIAKFYDFAINGFFKSYVSKM